jgi:hypothetical protein
MFTRIIADMRQLQLYSFLLMATIAVANGQDKPKLDIVATLLPNGDPHRVLTLTAPERQTAIKQLQAAQKQSAGKKQVQVAFLLAALGSDYARNSNYLIRNLRKCAGPSHESDCDVTAPGEFLIALYEQGHRDVLKPLMLTGLDTYNAALQESLGDFLARVLINSPAVFLDTIRPLTPKTQRRVCDLSGSTDGGGMSAANLQLVRNKLNAIHDEVAGTCLRAVEAANRSQ